ncbi:MAG TPA: hypothetical protein VFE24_04325 [Pirellulales bacterium]|jgi:hypothetical protein|nr:hypothetical protein [Pirellulales bacterium]
MGLGLVALGWGWGAARAEAENNAPKWIRQGAYVYRISTPDEANVFPQLEEGCAITANLLDGSIRQIPILNGIIGHDHPGSCNWDGVWPDWNRVTFRGNHDFKSLAEFMRRVEQNSNVRCSFHLNLTDVNVGLRDYPETRAFFDRLVKAQAIYRRDFNPRTGRFDLGDPKVPDKIPEGKSPIEIFALVNYQRFWKSGLAKEMIDQFYDRLPYPPPLLYLDVLNCGGGNFNTGFPDGPLGGSEATQRAGAIALMDYLHSKGSDVGTEGPRPEFGQRAGYVWLHGEGFSSDDYRVIAGGSWQLAAEQTWGNPGAFNLSPAAVSETAIAQLRKHYAALLDGQPGTLPVAGLKTWHLADRSDVHDAYDIPGTGDSFRGHWADLINDFYLTGIQELYHIGQGDTRVSKTLKTGWVHLGKYTLTAAGGQKSITVSVPDFVTTWQGAGARRSGQIMLEVPLVTKAVAPHAGHFAMQLKYKNQHHELASLNVYVNGKLFQSLENVAPTPNDDFGQLDLNDLELKPGENEIAFDVGPIRARWSDGTVAEWKTPYLRSGFRISNGDLLLAEDFDRMWPDTWSGQKKIYFFSWDGSHREWKLPLSWQTASQVVLHPLTPAGRGPGVELAVRQGMIQPRLKAQIPYIVVLPGPTQ